MSHINFICEIAHAYQHMPAYFHYITQNHAYLPTHTRTWVPMMAQWPPLMRGHPFWEATFTQHLGWLLVRGFTVCEFELELWSGNSLVGFWPLWPWPRRLDGFVIADGTVGCHNDNLRCHWWWLASCSFLRVAQNRVFKCFIYVLNPK